MSASIVIEDYLAASVQGSMDKASTFLAQPFTLTNFDDTGVLGWQWVLRDKPAGSSATITGANTATASITPDIAGTYLIQLLTYTDAATTLFDDADEQAIGVRYAGTEDYRIPAAGETTQFSTGRGWANEVNEILIDIRSKLGSGGGSGVRAVSIIVGNSVNGDSSDDCDFLDVGDGVQLAAAIAAADASNEVLIRPGGYTLTGPLTVGASVKVRGAGPLATRITVASSGNMGAFILGAGASLGALKVLVPVTTTTGTTSTALILANGAGVSLEDVTIDWATYDATQAGYLALRACVQLMNYDAMDVRGLKIINAPQLRSLSVSADMVGILATGGNATGTDLAHIISEPRIGGTDIGIQLQQVAHVLNPVITDPSKYGIYVNTTDADRSKILGGVIRHIAAAAADRGILLNNVNRCIVSGTGIRNTSTLGGVALEASGTVTKSNVVNCIVDNWTTAVTLGASTANNLVGMCGLLDNTNKIADTGTTNETNAHNIVA